MLYQNWREVTTSQNLLVESTTLSLPQNNAPLAQK
jgi:hypothetical protein